MIEGYMYLHENGDLIWKRFLPEQEPGGFVRRVWACDTADRKGAWLILIEALAMGARESRIRQLARKWHCTARDLVEFMVRHRSQNEEQREGLRLFLSRIVGVDPDEWFDWLASTPQGDDPDFDSMPTGDMTAC